MNTQDVKLTPRQKAFVTEFVVCRNGAEAARRAKYAVPSARIMASKLLSKSNIQAEIAAMEAKVSEKLDIDRHTVIGGVFSGIAQARDSNDAGGILRGWLAIGKITGLDKPEASVGLVLSASNSALEARFEAMSDAELLAIAEGSCG